MTAPATTFAPLRNLSNDYDNLRKNPGIVEAKKTDFFQHAIAVNDDELVAIAADQVVLAKEGLSPGMVICVRGQTLQGKKVLALCHFTDAWDFEPICRIVEAAMRKLGCVAYTVKSYVIGGEASKKYDSELKQKLDIIMAFRREKIAGVRFNYASPGEVASVVLTPDQVFISKKKLFESTNNETGIDILRQSLDDSD